MADSSLLTMLKVDLGISTTVYDTRLGQYLDSAQAEIEREGVSFPSTLTADDMQIIVMYAAWMWRNGRNGTQSPMPRMIRYMINNKLCQQKMSEVSDD